MSLVGNLKAGAATISTPQSPPPPAPPQKSSEPVPASPPDPKKLEEAAVKINSEYEAILTQDKNLKAEGDRIVNRAIAVGDMLLTVKQAVGHGNWLPWLTTKCFAARAIRS
jgi:hypothetical protein